MYWKSWYNQAVSQSLQTIQIASYQPLQMCTTLDWFSGGFQKSSTRDWFKHGIRKKENSSQSAEWRKSIATSASRPFSQGFFSHRHLYKWWPGVSAGWWWGWRGVYKKGVTLTSVVPSTRSSDFVYRSKCLALSLLCLSHNSPNTRPHG